MVQTEHPSGCKDERKRFQELQDEYFAKADADKFVWQTTNPYLEQTERNLLRGLPVRAADRLLEVGCGEGGNLTLLESLPRGAVGVDLSHAKVGWAHERITGARFVCSDAARLPFHDETFDVILCRDVLHHVPDKPQVVEEMIRVCRPSGRLVIIEPNGRSPVMRMLGLLIPAERDLLRNSQRRLMDLLQGRQVHQLELTWAQPFPIGRALFHYRWGFPRLSAPLVRLVVGLEWLIGQVMPPTLWGYMIVRALKHGCEPPARFRSMEGMPS